MEKWINKFWTRWNMKNYGGASYRNIKQRHLAAKDLVIDRLWFSKHRTLSIRTIFFHIQKVSTAWATSVCRAMEKSKKKDKIEMDSLVESGENSVKNSPSGDDEKQNLQVPVSGQTYGSTLSIGPAASTANLLKIDLEKKISRHTGKRYYFFATGKWKGGVVSCWLRNTVFHVQRVLKLIIAKWWKFNFVRCFVSS